MSRSFTDRVYRGILKDVPDYAVVAGVPARVIRYRCSPEEIKALNEIAWWDWSDKKIS